MQMTDHISMVFGCVTEVISTISNNCLIAGIFVICTDTVKALLGDYPVPAYLHGCGW